MHAAAHAQENTAETTVPLPEMGEICELRPPDSEVAPAVLSPEYHPACPPAQIGL